MGMLQSLGLCLAVLGIAGRLSGSDAATCECENGFSYIMRARAKNIFTSNIVGGSPVEPGEYEFIASLRYPEGSFLDNVDVSGEHYCGGVLIAKNIVMTAGHCVNSPYLKNIPVHINRYTRDGDDEGRFTAFTSIETRIHPKFRGTTFTSDYDVALLVLDGESQIEPASILKTESCFEDSACVFGTVLGWGLTVAEDKNSVSEELNSVVVPIIGKSDCHEEYKRQYGEGMISDAMVCAGDIGRDACNQDSGGPMIVKGKVAGIVSWGIGCGGEVPGVYTNVPYVKHWITSQIADINRVPSSAPSPAPPHALPVPQTYCRFILGRWYPAGCTNRRRLY